MVLDDKMTVMQVRPNYSIVYQFKPTLKLEKKYVKTEREFAGFIKGISTNWKAGDYFLKCSQGTFAYFNLNGSRIKFLKKSKMGKEYLCWEYFTKPSIKNNKKSRRNR